MLHSSFNKHVSSIKRVALLQNGAWFAYCTCYAAVAGWRDVFGLDVWRVGCNSDGRVRSACCVIIGIMCKMGGQM